MCSSGVVIKQEEQVVAAVHYYSSGVVIKQEEQVVAVVPYI